MTVMTDRESCDECDSNGNCARECERRQVWSNRILTHCGEAMGNEDANNRATLEHTALTVANFRCRSPTPTNVWMKDTWDDIGLEPDPNLAAEAMWKSPYIWVRNSPDTSTMFEKWQHQHQNPVAGQLNYIYVKIHNSGSATIDGTLKVFGANASTGLSWQSSFTEAGSLDLSLPAGVTRIVEFPWTPTGAGHFCLIARWSSTADPMTTAETARIDTNVRGNNNIVWRNVNIVGLGSPTESSATFLVRNLASSQARISLKVKPSDRYPIHTFLKFGKVSLHLDNETLASWQRGGFKGSGFKRVDQDVHIVDPNGATLEDLGLEKDAQREMKITFSLANEDHPRGTFFVDVVQGSMEDGEPTVVGGVTYEIHTDSAE